MLTAALHTTFALFARKLILSGEIIAIVCMVGWSLDARLGIPFWPRKQRGLQRLRDVLAGAATIAVVLFVAFVRDFADLGAQPDFLRYSTSCLAVIAAIAFFGAVASRFCGVVQPLNLLGLLVAATLNVVAVEGSVRIAAEHLAPIGAAFRTAGPDLPYHGMAVVLFGALVVASGVRVLLVGGRRVNLGTWDFFLASALTALLQGFLAYRGVSALFILLVAGLLAWGVGWRARVEYRSGRLMVMFARSGGPTNRAAGKSPFALERTVSLDALANNESAVATDDL